jgi:hypothetical protein
MGMSGRLNSLLQQHSKIGPNNESSTGELTVTRDAALNLANLWVAAWNAHDLDLLMTHYEEAVELTSPVAAQLLGTTDGKVVGKPNLRAYFQRGLEAYPELHFHLEDVLWGINSVVLYYRNQKGTRTAEFMATGEALPIHCTNWANVENSALDCVRQSNQQEES